MQAGPTCAVCKDFFLFIDDRHNPFSRSMKGGTILVLSAIVRQHPPSFPKVVIERS